MDSAEIGIFEASISDMEGVDKGVKLWYIMPFLRIDGVMNVYLNSPRERANNNLYNIMLFPSLLVQAQATRHRGFSHANTQEPRSNYKKTPFDSAQGVFILFLQVLLKKVNDFTPLIGGTGRGAARGGALGLAPTMDVGRSGRFRPRGGEVVAHLANAGLSPPFDGTLLPTQCPHLACGALSFHSHRSPLVPFFTVWSASQIHSGRAKLMYQKKKKTSMF